MSGLRAQTVFCDVVRQEVGSKLSLMGVYGSSLVLEGSVPAVVQYFAIANFAYPVEEEGESIVRLSLPGQEMKEIGRRAFKLKFPGDSVANVISLVPLEVEAEGNIVFELQIGSEVHRAELAVMTRTTYDARASGGKKQPDTSTSPPTF